MSAYYNEHDPFAAAWLRALIAGAHLPAGDVDERDIQDVKPAELAGYEQCHFFAGIGGWPLALRLPGCPDDRPVWTGSCPCQPYSSAGKGEGADDSRNLWPHWFRLIRERRPSVVFGEQAERAVKHGWLDAVSTDLEAEGYAFGAAVLGAHSVGAPHGRLRAFFVGDADRGRREVVRLTEHRAVEGSHRVQPDGSGAGRHGHWSRAVPFQCGDGKLRPAQSSIPPLAARVPNRVGTLRGAGNAIVPQVAAEFIAAYREAVIA